MNLCAHGAFRVVELAKSGICMRLWRYHVSVTVVDAAGAAAEDTSKSHNSDFYGGVSTSSVVNASMVRSAALATAAQARRARSCIVPVASSWNVRSADSSVCFTFGVRATSFRRGRCRHYSPIKRRTKREHAPIESKAGRGPSTAAWSAREGYPASTTSDLRERRARACSSRARRESRPHGASRPA